METTTTTTATPDQIQARVDRAVGMVENIAGPRPVWAVAAIVAQRRVDETDSQTDYFGSKTQGGPIVLAWSAHKRHVFPEMRKAALRHPETAHLGENVKANEHRENYSMGHGNYLSVGHFDRDGWKIRKQEYHLDQLERGIW